MRVSKTGVGTMIGIGFTIWSQVANVPAYTGPIAAAITGCLGVWWTRKHFIEDKSKAKYRASSFGLAVVGIVALAGAGVWWTLPVRIVPQEPYLQDRYAEQWGVGVSGERVVIPDGAHLPTSIGKRQMFTPIVWAPNETTLSNVTLDVCLPFGLSVEPSTTWQLADGNGCARYTVHFSYPINRGSGGNPPEGLFFRASMAGDFLVNYSISSSELAPHRGWFFVTVTP